MNPYDDRPSWLPRLTARDREARSLRWQIEEAKAGLRKSQAEYPLHSTGLEGPSQCGKGAREASGIRAGQNPWRILLKRFALALARGLHSLATRLAEWAGMHKRIEIIVINPGFEGTESALGARTLDFEEAASYNAALAELSSKLNNLTPTNRFVLMLTNEQGEQIGIDLRYYVSHRIADAEAWQSPWVLPSHGASAPPREES